MDRKAIEQIIFETLEKCGINVPLEVKFDYSCTQEPAKAREFVRITEGNWRNAIYVNKEGSKFGDAQYYDLLFVVDEGGEPLCIPVPVARQLFNATIAASLCKSTIHGSTYEAIYAKYYEKRSLPF
jgi:hypothetical protein